MFSILMFCFSGAILLYAGLLALTKDVRLIPRHYAAKIKDRQAYALAFARTMGLVGLAPMGAGVYGLIHPALGAVMLVVNMVLCIWLGTRFFKDM